MKLNNKQRAIMAAILGISNAGMDMIFLGRDPQVTPADAVKLYRQKDVTVEDAVYAFGQSFFESEAMAEMFIAEAKSWYKQLKTEDDVRPYRYDAFLDALLAADQATLGSTP